MNTDQLTAAFSAFAADFSTLATDVTAFIANNVPQDTPEQIAAVKAVTDGLTSMDATVKQLDASLKTPIA